MGDMSGRKYEIDGTRIKRLFENLGIKPDDYIDSLIVRESYTEVGFDYETHLIEKLWAHEQN
jgi:hypothetical protein